MSRIRKKLGAAAGIRTVRGLGYLMIPLSLYVSQYALTQRIDDSFDAMLRQRCLTVFQISGWDLMPS